MRPIAAPRPHRSPGEPARPARQRRTRCAIPSRRAIIRILIFALSLTAPAHAANPFAEANAAYEAGNFATARELYLDAVRSGPLTDHLFFNLGNTEYRLNHPGPAALAWERALVINPAHPEAAANLAYIRKKEASLVFEPPKALAWTAHLSRNTWLLAATVSGWLFLALVTLLALHRRVPGTRIAAAAAGLAAAASGTAFALTPPLESRAVVLAPKASARSAPSTSAAEILAPPPGSQARILRDQGAWIYAEFPGGRRAWLPSDSIAAVLPPTR